MSHRSYSFIIPVYNRPDEIGELLDSLTALSGEIPFEVVIVEDGSTESSETVVQSFQSKLGISYYSKENSGPGDSRNFGMRKAKGNYFLIFDSDCLLPPQYLQTVDAVLEKNEVDCFGGPDAAHSSFSNLQKAINFAMTSVITTGGIRGKKMDSKKFQPRSFNMGISKKAFEASGGFGKIHPGEDPDLAIRLKKLGFQIALIEEAFVYHKRRVSWQKFYQQVNKFGQVRPILNKWHPETSRLIYWLPTLFITGFLLSLIGLSINFYWLAVLYASYFVLAFIMALVETKSLSVATQSLVAIAIQFYGYGVGFLKSFIYIHLLNRNPQKQFPKLFFKNAE